MPTPLVITQQPAAAPQPTVIAAQQGVFSQVLIGACAGVVAWWLIEMLRDANQDEYEREELANDWRARAVYGGRRR